MWGAASFSHSILGEVGERIVDVSHGLFGSQISLLFRLEPKSGELMALAASGATEPQPLGAQSLTEGLEETLTRALRLAGTKHKAHEGIGSLAQERGLDLVKGR